jgi:hypothetical protein
MKSSHKISVDVFIFLILFIQMMTINMLFDLTIMILTNINLICIEVDFSKCEYM